MTLLDLVLVLAWLAAAVSTFALADAALDLKAVIDQQIGNGRRVYAKAQLRREVLRLVQASVLVGFATIAHRNFTSLGGWGRQLVLLYIGSQLILTVNVLLDLRLNRRVRRWFLRRLVDH